MTDDVHRGHCYQGEYEDSCKYGEVECPAKPVAPIELKTYRIGVPSYTCPTCGWKCNSPDGLRVSLPSTHGVYCMDCYGKWIHANIPKLIEDRHE
jgi:hypothetical protein